MKQDQSDLQMNIMRAVLRSECSTTQWCGLLHSGELSPRSRNHITVIRKEGLLKKAKCCLQLNL